MAQPPNLPSGQGPHGPGDAGGDPSMEDILASIRRILNEEEGEKAAPDTGDAHPGTEEAFVLQPSMMEPEPAVEPRRAAAGSGFIDLAAADLDPGAPGPVAPASPFMAIPPHEEPTGNAPTGNAPIGNAFTGGAPPVRGGLVAPAAAQAAATSLGTLVRTLAQERSTAVRTGGPTIEDLVREEMRPILAAWLDTHLPPMVERLVRAEIERVVGRASL